MAEKQTFKSEGWQEQYLRTMKCMCNEHLPLRRTHSANGRLERCEYHLRPRVLRNRGFVSPCPSLNSVSSWWKQDPALYETLSTESEGGLSLTGKIDDLGEKMDVTSETPSMGHVSRWIQAREVEATLKRVNEEARKQIEKKRALKRVVVVSSDSGTASSGSKTSSGSSSSTSSSSGSSSSTGSSSSSSEKKMEVGSDSDTASDMEVTRTRSDSGTTSDMSVEY